MPLAHGHLHRRAGLKHEVAERDAVVKTVYVTASATFDGGVAGYSTAGKAVKATKAADKDSGASKQDDSDEEDEAKTTAKPKATSTAKAEKAKTKSEEKKKVAETTKEKVVETTKEKEKENTKTKETETTKPAKTTKTSKAEAKTTSTEKDSSTVPSAITDPTGSAESVLAKATGQASASTTLQTSADGTAASTLSSVSASAEASTSSASSSPGTKAGIAFGVLGGIFVVGLLVFLLFSRRRKQAESQRLKDDDEKLHGPMNPAMVVAASTAPRTDPKAPRISLRPVTQFLPNWNLEKRSSKGAAMALAVPGAAAGGAMTSRAAPGGSAWERPSTAQSADPANPFGAQAERVPTPIMEESFHDRSATPNSTMEKDAIRPVSPVSSIGIVSPASDPLSANGAPVVAGAAAGAATAGASAALLARKTSMRRDGPKKLDLTLPNPPLAPVPASPAGTEFSMSSTAPGASDAPSHGAAAIAAAGGPVNSSVYRVQLDFKPTLDDELGLTAGDLVRMLHEYDDGWALCIRLDRSQQGVVPRTCLSTRPVKPRPAQGGPRPGPPINPSGPHRGPMVPPGQRPMTPQGMQRPMAPQGMQAQGRPGSPAGRPMTPTGGRSQSPMGRPVNPPGRPAGRPMSPGPRSQSPGPRQGPPAGRPMSPGPRSQSPGPRQGPPGGRSQSPSGANRRNSPPGPSPMNPSQAPQQAPLAGSPPAGPPPTGPPPAGPPTGPVGRKPVPGQAY